MLTNISVRWICTIPTNSFEQLVELTATKAVDHALKDADVRKAVNTIRRLASNTAEKSMRPTVPRLW